MRLSSTRSKQQRRVVVRRKAHAMDENLAFVKWAEIVRRGIAKADDANQLVARRIDDGNRVGVLIGCVDAVMRTDRHVRLVEGCLSILRLRPQSMIPLGRWIRGRRDGERQG